MFNSVFCCYKLAEILPIRQTNLSNQSNPCTKYQYQSIIFFFMFDISQYALGSTGGKIIEWNSNIITISMFTFFKAYICIYVEVQLKAVNCNLPIIVFFFNLTKVRPLFMLSHRRSDNSPSLLIFSSFIRFHVKYTNIVKKILQLP